MLKIRKRSRKITLPKLSRMRHSGDTHIDDLNIGDTFEYDGVTSTVYGFRETEKCMFIDVGNYERKFWKDTYVNWIY